MEDFAAALAGAKDPAETYAALGRLADALVGAKLFTLLTFDPANGLARRFYSNMPDAYPVSATKPIPESDWGNRVLSRGETFVGNDIEALAAVFPDHQLINSLGCGACINVPIFIAGSCYGTINCLHETGHYNEERVELSEGLKLPGVACFLLERISRG